MFDHNKGILRPHPTASKPLMVINFFCTSNTKEDMADIFADENFGEVLKPQINVSFVDSRRLTYIDSVSQLSICENKDDINYAAVYGHIIPCGRSVLILIPYPTVERLIQRRP